MLNNIYLVIRFSLVIFIIGCSSGNETQNDLSFKFGVGKYKFTMSDSTGKKIAEGTLDMKSKTNNIITGKYEFTNIYEKDFEGLSSMNGLFEGNIIPAEKKVFINTNPRIADSNVYWNMTIKKNSVSGEWFFSVFRGSLSGGKVTIVKL